MGAVSESVAVEKDAPSRTRQSPGSVLSSTSALSTPTQSRLVSAAGESPLAATQIISQTGPNAAVLQRAQRSYGNRASQQIVMRARAVQRKCDCGGSCAKCQEEEEQRVLQRSAGAQASPGFHGIPPSQGEPLGPETLHPLEAYFQSDLSDVRVHANTEAAESAEALDAHAYTTGSDIYFAPGMYAPATTQGRRLLAHEVAHVVQQSSGKEPAIAMKSAHGVKIGAPEDILESEAEQAADAFLHGETPQTEIEKRRLSPSPSSSPTVLRELATTSETPATPAPAVSTPTLAEAVTQDDIAAALPLIRGRSPSDLATLRTAVHDQTNVYLERWFIGKIHSADRQKTSEKVSRAAGLLNPAIVLAEVTVSYLTGDAKKRLANQGVLAEEGLRWMWRALPLIDRLEIYDEGYREIEQAQLDTIKHASDQEKADVRKETQRLEAVYKAMDAKEEYQARVMIDPSRAGLFVAATKLLGNASTPLWGDKDIFYDAVLKLDPADRRTFFAISQSVLRLVLWDYQFDLVKTLSQASEAQALIARLQLATKKRSDDMEAVQAVVDRAVQLLGQKRMLAAQKADPHLSETDRASIESRLRELGDLEDLLKFKRDNSGKLDADSFLALLSDARSDPDAFGGDAVRLAGYSNEPAKFNFEFNKQRLLLAKGDQDALTHTLLTIHAPRVQPKPGASASSASVAQWSADVEFRKALLDDPAVHDVITSLKGSEQVHVLSAVQGDDFNEALDQLNQFRLNAQWGAFFDLVLKIDAKHEWRSRYEATSTDPFGVFAGTFGEERDIMLEILRTHHMPLTVLLDYTDSVATLQAAFAHISPADRYALREGWAISRSLVMGPLTPEQEKSKELFLKFEAKAREKLGKSSDFEDVLNAGLGTIPTAKEVSTPEGRYQAAALMYERIEARLALDRGLAAEFTETDETMVAAGREFAALWLRVRDLHALTFVDFSVLAELHDTFVNRAQEFTEASRAITDLAATIAATVAGLVVIAATGGAATPAVVALAAAAGAGAGFVTREMFGGDYYRADSSEAAKAALMDSINGALAVVSGSLAAKGTELLGLSGRALTAGAARVAGSVAEEATVSFGQKLAATAVESAIDGFFSGAVSEAFGVMLDESTWRKGIWAGVLKAGRAAITAGLQGMALGGVLGSATQVAGAGLSKFGRVVFNQGLDKTLERAGASDLLAAARSAAKEGKVSEVTRLMDQMEAHLTPEEANILRQDLNAQLHENLGHPPGTAKPSTPQQEDLLRQSGLKDSGDALSKEELDAEHAIVENSEPQISSESGYVDEVDLGNGHTWRRAEDGTWCRFTTKSLCKTGLNAKPMSPTAAARARRLELQQQQVRAAGARLGAAERAVAQVEDELKEFDKLIDQVLEDARNGKKFGYRSLTPEQQTIVREMFPHAEEHELEAMDLAALRRRRLQFEGTANAPGLLKRLEQRVPVEEAALTSAKQPLSARLRSVPAETERNMIRRSEGFDELSRAKPLSGKLSIEHVYPLSKIMALKGSGKLASKSFLDLGEAEMKILANWPRNLKMTDLEANILRRERSYSQLSSLEFGKYYTPQHLEAAARLEMEMEAELQKELDRMLAAQPTVQRSPASRGRLASWNIGTLSDDGQMLPESLRISLESHFRVDLSPIRIHADSSAGESAQNLDAHAYATGRDIYFAPGMYAPATTEGQRLLAHEIAHVLQQSSGKEPAIAMKSAHGVKIGAPGDIRESEAEQVADRFQRGDASTPSEPRQGKSEGTSIVRRKPAGSAKGTDLGADTEPAVVEDVLAGKSYDMTTKEGALSYAQDWHTQFLREYQLYMTPPYGKAPGDLGISFTKQQRTGRAFFIYTSFYWPLLRQQAESAAPMEVFKAISKAVNAAYKEALTEEDSAIRIPPRDYRTLFPETFAKEYDEEAKRKREEAIKGFADDEKWKLKAAEKKDKDMFVLFATGQYRPRFMAELLEQEAARIRKGQWDPLLFSDHQVFYWMDAHTKAESVAGAEYDKYVDQQGNASELWKAALETKEQWRRDLEQQNKSDQDTSAAEKDLVALSITASTLRSKLGREVLPAAVIDAWDKADDALIGVRPAAAKGDVPEAVRNRAADLVAAFYQAFRASVTGYDKEVIICRYGACVTLYPNIYFSRGTLAAATQAIRSASTKSEWKTAFDRYNEAVTAMDQFIADQLEKKGRKDDGEQLKAMGGRAQELTNLLEEHKDAQKVQAVFYPLDQLENVGAPGVPDFAAKGIPLLFYIYRDDGDWNLSDITTPQHVKVTSASGGTSSKPDMDIFSKVNSKLRFPKGRIYFTLPDETIWLQQTTEPWRLSEWLTWIGLGVAALALGIVTFGASIPAEVIIFGAIVGVGAAVSDIVEKKRAGVLGARDVAVDGLQIVASILSAGSARLGATVLSEAASAGIAASEVGGLAGRLFIPVTIAAIGADFTSFAVLTVDVRNALAEIDKQPGSEEDRRLAKLRLLSSFIASGLMTFLAIRSNISAVRVAGAGVHIDVGLNGEPVARPLLKDPELLDAAKGVKNSDAITQILGNESLSLDLRNRLRAGLSEALTSGPIAPRKLDELLLRLRAASKPEEINSVLAEINARSRIGAITDGEVAARVSSEDAALLARLDADTFGTLKGGSPRDLRAISSVLAADAKEGPRLVREYRPEMVDYLRTNPLPDIAKLEDILAKVRARVTARTPGWVEGIDTSKPPEGGWKFNFGDPAVVVEKDGTKVSRIDLNGPNGAKGAFETAYNPVTRKLEFREAFLRMRGAKTEVPKFIPKQGGAPEMIEGGGTPTVQYVTVLQMKLLGVPMGGELSTSVRFVHLDHIEHVETLIHLHWLRQKFPTTPIDELFEFTSTAQRVETTLVQTGYQRSGKPVIIGGENVAIRKLMAFQEKGRPAIINYNKQLLERYGFNRDTVMLYGFGVDFPVLPKPQ
jgi:hypothetical protein